MHACMHVCMYVCMYINSLFPSNTILYFPFVYYILSKTRAWKISFFFKIFEKQMHFCISAE